MDSTKIEDELKAVEAKIVLLKNDLDLLSERYVEEIVPYASTWISMKFNDFMMSNPNLVVSFGDDGIAPAKEEHRQLLADLSGIVKEEVGRAKLWPHRHAEMYSSTQRVYESGIYVVLGRLGAILKKYGFEPFSKSWRESPGRSTVRWEFNGPLDLPVNIIAIANQYDDKYNAYVGLQEQATNLRNQMTINKAQAILNDR